MATRRASRAPHTGTFVARSERDFQASRNVRLRGTPIGPDAARRQLTRTWHCYLACALHTDPPGPLACTCKTNPVLAPNSRHTANYRPQVHPCPPGLRTQPPGWVRRLELPASSRRAFPRNRDNGLSLPSTFDPHPETHSSSITPTRLRPRAHFHSCEVPSSRAACLVSHQHPRPKSYVLTV